MKYLVTKMRSLIQEGRWDADYHLPPIGIRKYPPHYQSMKVPQLKSLAKENGISGYASMNKENLINLLKGLPQTNYESTSAPKLKALLKAAGLSVYGNKSELIERLMGLSLVRISDIADLVTENRDPTKDPDKTFQYISISSVDVDTGEIKFPEIVYGQDAPSRARKVVRTGDVIVSTTRPTRGSVAVVLKEMDDEICSTGFCVLRPKKGFDSHVIQFLLRLDSTREQFRKWSAGLSYPAMLPEDVMKTKVPIIAEANQKEIAGRLIPAMDRRNKAIKKAIEEFNTTLDEMESEISFVQGEE